MNTFNVNQNGVVTNPMCDTILDIKHTYRLDITYAEIDGVFHFGHKCSSNIKGLGYSLGASPCSIFREIGSLDAAKAYLIDIEIKSLTFWQINKKAKCDDIIKKLKDVRNTLIFKQLTIF